MRIEASGWARTCGKNTVAKADIANTRYLNSTLRRSDDATVMADHEGTITISISKKKLILNGNYNVDLVLSRDDILTLAKMALNGQEFSEVVRKLGKVEKPPSYLAGAE
jgi:hypothetical protein